MTGCQAVCLISQCVCVCLSRCVCAEVQDDAAGTVDLADEDGEEGVLAVLQDESGQQQTVRLTPSQAAALGIDYDELLAAAGQVRRTADPLTSPDRP